MVGVMNVSAQDYSYFDSPHTQVVDAGSGVVSHEALAPNRWSSSAAYDYVAYGFEGITKTNLPNVLTVDDSAIGVLDLGFIKLIAMDTENGKLKFSCVQENTITITAPKGWLIVGYKLKATCNNAIVTYEGVNKGNNTYEVSEKEEVLLTVKPNSKILRYGTVICEEFEVYLKRLDTNPSDERLNEVTGVYDGVRYWEWVQENPVKKGDFYKIVNYTSYDSKIQAAGQDTKQIVNDIEEAGEWYLAEDGSITTIYGDVRQSRPIYDGVLSSDATGWDVTPKGSGANLLGYQIHAMPVVNTYYIIADENQMKDPHVIKLGNNDEEGDPDVPIKDYSIWNFYTLEQYDCYVDYKNAYETFMALNEEFGSGKEEEDDEYVALREKVLDFVAHGNTEDSRYEAYEWINKMLDLVAVLKGSTGDGKLENPGAEELKKYWRFRRTKTKEESWSSATTDNKRSGSRMFDLRNCTMSQDIKNLKTGVYKLTVWWQARGEMDGDPASTIVLKASGSADSQEIKLVGTNTTGENNWKQASLDVTVVDGRLTVSATANTYIHDHGWANLDDFELTRIYKYQIIDDEENKATLYKGVFDGRDDEGREYEEETIAKVTVDRPYADVTAAYFRSMKFDRSLNPNGLCYAAAGKKVTGLDGDADVTNIVKGKVCESLELKNGKPYSTLKEFTAKNAKYDMNSFGKGLNDENKEVTFGTLMLPYAVEIPSDAKVKVYTTSGVSDNGNLVLSEVSEIEANKPYLVEYTGTGTAEFKAYSKEQGIAVENIGQVHGEGALVGAYQLTEVENDGTNYLLQKQNGKLAFYRVTTTGLNVGPFRCYLHIPSAENAPSKISMVFEDEATGIVEIENAGCADVVYDIQGRRVENAVRPGIYVKNGKKYLVK